MSVTDHDVRPLAETEYRDAHALFMAALHRPRATDGDWPALVARYEAGRVWGDFLGGELAGTTASLPSSLSVPGGAVLPAAAVTGVGVRADRTRRGVLTSMMRSQLDDVWERGEPLAMLHASETGIYGRFGYGVSTRTRTVSLDTQRALLAPTAPSGGDVRLVEVSEARKILPEIYERIGAARPGTIARTPGWWDTRLLTGAEGDQLRVAVHSDADGIDDGFALWNTRINDHRFDNGVCTLQVSDLRGADAVAAVELWRFLLNLDLANVIVAADRPLDEPLEWWLADSRQCRVRGLHDDLWLRLVDVPTALAARAYGAADPVVLEVRDAFLPSNSGCYRLGPEGARRCEDRPQLTVDADMLGTLYLGDVSVATLAAANRVTVHDDAAVAAADRLLATSAVPWCGTGF